MNQLCPVTETDCVRECVQICRNYCNGKAVPIRGDRHMSKDDPDCIFCGEAYSKHGRPQERGGRFDPRDGVMCPPPKCMQVVRFIEGNLVEMCTLPAGHEGEHGHQN